MAKILNVNDMLDAAAELERQGLIANAKRLAVVRENMDAAASALAEFLAEERGLRFGPATYEEGAGGLCANFYVGPDGKTCDTIGEGDPGGNWDKARDDPTRATWAEAEAAGYAIQAPHGEDVVYPASNTFTLPGGEPDPLNRKFVSAAYAREAAADHLEETR